MYNIFKTIITSLSIIILYACFGSLSMEFNSAKTYVRVEKNLIEGEEWALKALDKEPDNAQIPFFLAIEVYRPQKEYNKMNAMFKEALKRNSNLKLEQPLLTEDGKEIKTIHDAIYYHYSLQ